MLTSFWPPPPLGIVLSGHAYLRLASFSEDCFCCAVSFAWFLSSWACCCFSVSFLNRAALSSLSKWYFLYNTTFFKNFLSVSIGYLLPKKREKTKCLWTTMLTWEKVSNSAEDWANLWLNPKHWTHKKIENIIVSIFSNRTVPYLWKNLISPIYTNLNSSDTRMFCVMFGWNGPVVLEKKIFESCQCIFYVTIICPWKKAWTLIWTHLIPYNQRMLCAMFGWIWTGFF